MNKHPLSQAVAAACVAFAASQPAQGRQNVQVSQKVTMAGKFKLEAVRPDGTRRVLADWFDNLIVDQGLNRIGTGTFMPYCHVGTGSTAPGNSDTALVAFVAATNTVQAETSGTASSSPYYGYRVRTYRFAQGAAAGNLTEVGIGWASTGAVLFSRALIKDGGGSPTTITVLSDEFLDVSYELRCYAPTSDSVVTVTISGTNYDFTCRAANVTNSLWWAPRDQAILDTNTSGSHVEQSAYNGSIGAVTALPSGTSDAPKTVTKQTYSNNSYRADFACFWDLNDGNLAGFISAMVFSSSLGSFQMGVTPDIEKDGTKLLTLTYRVTWARH